MTVQGPTSAPLCDPSVGVTDLECDRDISRQAKKLTRCRQGTPLTVVLAPGSGEQYVQVGFIVLEGDQCVRSVWHFKPSTFISK